MFLAILMSVIFVLLVGLVVYGIGVIFDVDWRKIFLKYGKLWDGDRLAMERFWNGER
jgi:hypothetical protein